MAEREKRVLIVGAAGFVGGHLISCLHEAGGFRVSATKLENEKLDLPGLAAVHSVDILQPEPLRALLETEKPEWLFHLAAQSNVALAWKQPAFTARVNLEGAVNVLETVREVVPGCRVLLVGSSEEYGFVRPEENPVREDALPRPGNLYAVTKNAQNQLGRVYAKAYGLQVMCTRSFNHIGPGQAPGFVLPDFCRQVAEIEAGLREPMMRVGNLAAKRDFCDVRDIVAAYLQLAEKGEAGETYNVGSGCSVPIEELLRRVLALAAVPIRVEQDPARMRPSDLPDLRADIGKLRALCGWEPRIPLEETLRQTLDEWRNLTKGQKDT